MATFELDIEGMTCGHCVRAVERALTEIPGVTGVKVEIGHAHVEASEAVSREALVGAIEEEDYRVTG